MRLRPATWPALLAACLGLGGCAVVPADDYGYYEDDRYYDRDRYYERETVIVTPPPRIEYRGLPPAAGYIWIDGYWNRVGPRPHWVPGYWSPPQMPPRAIVQPRPGIDTRPDWRHDRRDEHDRKRWGEEDRRRDDRRGDDKRWSGRDDDNRREGERWRDRDGDPRTWPGFTPRRDPRGDRDGTPERPQLRDHRDPREGARPPRIVREPPPGAREGLLHAEPPRQRIERPSFGTPGGARPELRPAGAAGEARSPRRSEAGGRAPEGLQGGRRDGDGESRHSFRRETREARDGGNAPEARRRESAGN